MPNATDYLFKNALDGLPDAPPAFDAEAVWGELDRQLRPRRRPGLWWVAAGVLVWLGLGGWLFFRSTKAVSPGHIAQTAHRNPPRPTALPVSPSPLVLPAKEPARHRPLLPKRVSPPGRPESSEEVVQPTPYPAAETAHEDTVSGRIQAAAVLQRQDVAVVKTPKAARFRVVHINELPPGNSAISTETQPDHTRPDPAVRVVFALGAAPELTPTPSHRLFLFFKKQPTTP